MFEVVRRLSSPKNNFFGNPQLKKIDCTSVNCWQHQRSERTKTQEISSAFPKEQSERCLRSSKATGRNSRLLQQPIWVTANFRELNTYSPMDLAFICLSNLLSFDWLQVRSLPWYIEISGKLSYFAGQAETALSRSACSKHCTECWGWKRFLFTVLFCTEMMMKHFWPVSELCSGG